MTFDPTNITPGLYEGVDNEAYHSAHGVSKSGLDAIDKTPAHYLAYTKRQLIETPAMRTGRLIHQAVLEPELFDEKYVVAPEDAPRRPSVTQLNAKNPSEDTKAAIAWWEEFDAAHEGVEIIKAEERCEVLNIRDAVWGYSPSRAILSHEGVSEVSAWGYDEPTGLLRKCRPDRLIKSLGVVVDLKSAEDASREAFEKAVYNHRYFVQDPYYRDTLELAGVEAQSFVFIVVEKKPPYAVGVYNLDQRAIYLGREAYRRNLERLSECLLTRHWPGYTEKIETIGLPAWAYRKEENAA